MFEKTGFVPFGAAMPKQGIQKFTAQKGEQYIKILSVAEQHFLFAKVHYLEGVGYFHCFGGSCCKACADAGDKGSTSERAILPIAVYKPGLRGRTLDFAYLPLPEQKYSTLVNLHQSVGDITAYDIKISCEDEKYQKYTFIPILNEHPMINSMEDSSILVGNFLRDYEATITKTIGKTIDEVEFNRLRAKSLQQAASSVGVSFQPNASASQAFMNNAPQVALPQPKPVIAAQPVPLGAPVIAAQPVPLGAPVVPPANIPTPQVIEAAQVAPVVPPANIPTPQVIEAAQMAPTIPQVQQPVPGLTPVMPQVQQEVPLPSIEEAPQSDVVITDDGWEALLTSEG